MSVPLPSAERINALLPQTQCTKCGFDGCRPYAEAIAAGSAPINRCPPGGHANIQRLAALTGLTPLPLDPSCGVEAPRRLAWIDPSLCIGCTKCIDACPVDAIIGAPKFLHAVLIDDCTGCDLCLPPCPVDCIEMRPIDGDAGWSTTQASEARQRYEAHRRRLEHDARNKSQRRDRLSDTKVAQTSALTPIEPTAPADAGTAQAAAAEADPAAERKRRIIEAATRRAREKLSGG